jgi:hypothetical protein
LSEGRADAAAVDLNTGTRTGVVRGMSEDGSREEGEDDEEELGGLHNVGVFSVL